MRAIFVGAVLLLMPLSVYYPQCAVQANEPVATVYYDIVARKGEIIQLQVQYEAPTPTADVRDLHFYPREHIPDGEYEYRCSAIEGGTVIFRFKVENARLRGAQVDTNYRPKPEVDEEEKTLSLKSTDGVEILFTFSFQAGQIVNVRITPKINPFS